MSMAESIRLAALERQVEALLKRVSELEAIVTKPAKAKAA